MIYYIQIFLFFILHTPVTFFLRIRVEGLEHVQPDNIHPLIIASNHPSRIDPFFISVLPWGIVRRILPIYAPTSEYYCHKWWFKPFFLIGAYPIKKISWSIEELLGPTREKLLHKGNLILFPEGRIAKNKEKVAARSGIIHVAKETGARILPFFIQGIEGVTCIDFFLRKRSAIIKIKEPFFVSQDVQKSQYKEVAQNLMNVIYDR